MFSNLDFLSGEVRWMEHSLEEDMLRVQYPNGWVLDVSYQESDGSFIILIVRDGEWGVPVVQYETQDPVKLRTLVIRAIDRIEEESNHTKPNYGPLWKTELISM